MSRTAPAEFEEIPPSILGMASALLPQPLAGLRASTALPETCAPPETCGATGDARLGGENRLGMVLRLTENPLPPHRAEVAEVYLNE